MSLIETAAEGFPIQYVFLIVGVAALVFVMNRRRRREATDVRPPGAFEAPSRDPRGELEHLLAEIQELSRDHIARLDTKIRLLTQLLQDCDQKKRELEALLDRTPAPAAKAAKPAHPLHDQVYGLVDSGKDVSEICTATGLEKGEVELILGLRRPDAKL